MRTSYAQYYIMVDFMEKHGDISRPGHRGQLWTTSKWEELSALLECEDTVSAKRIEKWRKVWTDLKNNTKKKWTKIYGKSQTPENRLKICLSDVERRVMAILGVENVPGLVIAEPEFVQLPNDMENYMKYHVMGSVAQVRMKPGCMPHKFICQPDWKKRTSDTTERPYIAIKRKKMILEECNKELEEKCLVTEQSSFEEIASGSSVKQYVEEFPQLTSRPLDNSIEVQLRKTLRSKADQKKVFTHSKPAEPCCPSIKTEPVIETDKLEIPTPSVTCQYPIQIKAEPAVEIDGEVEDSKELSPESFEEVEDWNTPGPSKELPQVPPRASTRWRPRMPKKSKALNTFIESNRYARENERERDKMWYEIERERIRQRDVELQLQGQWLEFMKEALVVVKGFVESQKSKE